MVVSAAGAFAVTNVDELVLLALFFGQAGSRRDRVIAVVVGQYLGLGIILGVSVLGAAGAGLLPGKVIAYLGLLPLFLGLAAAWSLWRGRHTREQEPEGGVRDAQAPTVWRVTALTVANSGDNVGVYIPLLAAAGAAGTAVYVVVFLVGTALWCAAGRYFATRPRIAEALARWGHLAMPVVLIATGVGILLEAGAFGT